MSIQLGDPGNDILKDINRKIKPQPKQADFLSIPDNVFEALFGGAAYGGKSYILTLFPLIRGFYKYRGFKGIILRRKFPDLEREIIRLSKEWYPHTGAKYNEQKHTWEWPQYGSYVDFGHVQHSADISQYDSAQYNYCAFDELTHFEEAPYRYMVGSRVRPGSDSISVAIVRNGTNPGGVGQTFVYNRFVKPCEDGYKLIKDKKTGLYRMFIPSYMQDNPAGMSYDPDYSAKLEIMPEAEKRAKKYGDWHAFEGSVFPEFRPLRFPGEPENALHVVEPFTIPEWWLRFLSIDWGKRAMCHALWAALSPDGIVYIYRERHWYGKDVAFWGSEVKELSQGENIVNFTLCGSAWQNRGVETIADQAKKYTGLNPVSSDNSAGSRIAGVQLLHDFLRWETREHLIKAPGEFYDLSLANDIFRRFGAEALARYRSKFMDEEEFSNLPKLRIFEHVAPKLIEAIPVAVYSDTNPEDIAEFDGDDPLDNVRYLCKAVSRYQSDPLVAQRLQTIDNAVKALNQTNDQTAFYRKMEVIEREEKTEFGARRFNRRRR